MFMVQLIIFDGYPCLISGYIGGWSSLSRENSNYDLVRSVLFVFKKSGTGEENEKRYLDRFTNL